MELYNLTLANEALGNENKNWVEQVLNLTQKTTKDGQRLEVLKTSTDTLNTVTAISHEDNSLLKMELYNLTLTKDKLVEQVHNLTQESIKDKLRLADMDVHASVMNITMFNNHVDLLELSQKQGCQSGFTAQNPKAGTTSGSISFIDIKSNIGNHYNPVSGTFTCVYPGFISSALCLSGI